ncbi:transcriptional regulator, partial [Streptomyces canus]
GELELYCQRLIDPDQAQELLVFSATPGSPSYEKLQLLPAVRD